MFKRKSSSGSTLINTGEVRKLKSCSRNQF